jgi:indole-3-glycerol phosphate synthase
MDFLQRIVPAVERSTEDPRYLGDLPERPRPGRRSLARAVRDARGRGALLVEHKLASPGARGSVLPQRTPEEFLERLEGAPVAALSGLATEPVFGGSPGLVRRIAGRTRLPVLFKDFVIGPRQVEAAERAGCSAVLLIARLATRGLLRTPLSDLAEEAHRRGLEVLLELHRPEEAELLTTVRCDLVGVNVRDLETLRLKPTVAAATLAQLPPSVPRLALSGVAGPADAARWWSLGADGLLVGTAAALAEDAPRFLNGLLRPGAREVSP